MASPVLFDATLAPPPGIHFANKAQLLSLLHRKRTGVPPNGCDNTTSIVGCMMMAFKAVCLTYLENSLSTHLGFCYIT
eukprot:12427401-Karenia_brevis.AAC.1